MADRRGHLAAQENTLFVPRSDLKSMPYPGYEFNQDEKVGRRNS